MPKLEENNEKTCEPKFNSNLPGFGDNFGSPCSLYSTNDYPGFGNNFGKNIFLHPGNINIDLKNNNFNNDCKTLNLIPNLKFNYPGFGKQCSTSSLPTFGFSCSIPYSLPSKNCYSQASRSLCAFSNKISSMPLSFPSLCLPSSKLTFLQPSLALQSSSLLPHIPSYGTTFGFGSFNSPNLYAASLNNTLTKATSTPIALPAAPVNNKEPIECTTICGKKSEIDSVKQIIKGTNLVNF